MRAQFITAEEVQQILNVSRSKSYQIIRDLNKELKSMGYPVYHREQARTFHPCFVETGAC